MGSFEPWNWEKFAQLHVFVPLSLNELSRKTQNLMQKLACTRYPVSMLRQIYFTSCNIFQGKSGTSTAFGFERMSYVSLKLCKHIGLNYKKHWIILHLNAFLHLIKIVEFRLQNDTYSALDTKTQVATKFLANLVNLTAIVRKRKFLCNVCKRTEDKALK